MKQLCGAADGIIGRLYPVLYCLLRDLELSLLLQIDIFCSDFFLIQTDFLIRIFEIQKHYMHVCEYVLIFRSVKNLDQKQYTWKKGI